MTRLIADADALAGSGASPAEAPEPVRAWRRALGLTAGLGALLVTVVGSVLIGSQELSVSEVWNALTTAGDTQAHFIVNDLRIPRTLVGLTVGIALGIAGALIQALTRNPLADPGILGVNAGAAFFVALGVSVFGVSSIGGYVWFAFAGAFVVTVAVYLIGSAGRGGADPVQLTLAGVALGAVLSGVVTAMVLLDSQTFNQMRSWNAGSIVNRGWDILLPVLPFLAVGLVLAGVAVGALNSIALGDDLARSLGTNITRTRVLVIIAVTLLAGGATAVAGPIGFVGLMVPHIARWIVGPDQRWILAYTIVLAPVLVLAADVLGRIVIRPAEFPVGIVTAFVGAPVLILLVRRKRASGL